MKRARRRKIGVVKWIATTICLLMALVWIGSERWCLCYIGTRWNVAIINGAIETTYYRYPGPPSEPKWRFYRGYGPLKSYWPATLHHRWGVEAMLPLWIPTVLLVILISPFDLP